MSKRIFGLLLALILIVTGFGFVGCGGIITIGPTQEQEVTNKDTSTIVDVEETGLDFNFMTAEEYGQCHSNWSHGWNWRYEEDENVAIVIGINRAVEDLIIPEYVVDGTAEYKVVGVDNLIMNTNNAGVNEHALGIKTITIPATVEYVEDQVFSDTYRDYETNEYIWVYLESLEKVIINDRDSDLPLSVMDYLYCRIADRLNISVSDLWSGDYPEGTFHDGLVAIFQEEYDSFFNKDENDENLFYLGNDDNPYLMLWETSFWCDGGHVAEITRVSINNNCKIIGCQAFSNISSLTSVEIPEGVIVISCDAFWGAGISEISLPTTLKEIWYGAFCGCRNLTSITIPEGVVFIDENAFYSCNSLDKLIIPSSVKYLGFNVVERGQPTNVYINSADVYNATYIDWGWQQEYGYQFVGSNYFYVLSSVVDENECGIIGYHKLSNKISYNDEEYYMYILDE